MPYCWEVRHNMSEVQTSIWCSGWVKGHFLIVQKVLDLCHPKWASCCCLCCTAVFTAGVWCSCVVPSEPMLVITSGMSTAAWETTCESHFIPKLCIQNRDQIWTGEQGVKEKYSKQVASSWTSVWGKLSSASPVEKVSQTCEGQPHLAANDEGRMNVQGVGEGSHCGHRSGLLQLQ